MFKNFLLWLSLAVVLIVMPVLVFIARVYSTTPANLRRPQTANHYFRLQVVVEGETVDFGQSPYQDPGLQTQCGDSLAQRPLYASSGLDQIIHVRWAGIRGGDVLKYYGINNLGSQDGFLGYRLDESVRPQKIDILGNFLPLPEEDSEYWVYTNDPAGVILYRNRTIDDFNLLDLETFLDKKSTLTQSREDEAEKDRWFDPVITAFAQDEIAEDPAESTSEEDEEEELPQDFLGDIVIFVQEDQPEIEEIIDRFENVVELPNIRCSS